MKNTPVKNSPNRRSSHQIRIIGGQWKRSVLTVLDAEGLRPTPDRVRETVFNWLNHLLDQRWQSLQCLDLFAGSGALGFEAASRGAAGVQMLELQKAAYQQILAVKAKLKAEQCQVHCQDALQFIDQAIRQQQHYGLIFLDPPFGKGWLERLLPKCEQLLQPGGLLYVEAEYNLQGNETDPALQAMLAGWQVLRADKAGSAHFHILQRNN